MPGDRRPQPAPALRDDWLQRFDAARSPQRAPRGGGAPPRAVEKVRRAASSRRAAGRRRARASAPPAPTAPPPARLCSAILFSRGDARSPRGTCRSSDPDPPARVRDSLLDAAMRAKRLIGSALPPYCGGDGRRPLSDVSKAANRLFLHPQRLRSGAAPVRDLVRRDRGAGGGCRESRRPSSRRPSGWRPATKTALRGTAAADLRAREELRQRLAITGRQ